MSFIWHINLDRSFYRFVTIHACDGQTDRPTDEQTEFSSQYCVCITCSAVIKLRNAIFDSAAYCCCIVLYHDVFVVKMIFVLFSHLLAEIFRSYSISVANHLVIIGLRNHLSA